MAGAATTSTGGLRRRRGLAMSILIVLLIVAASWVGCQCAGQRCHDDERRALLEIKKSVSHPNGTDLQDWGLAGEDCCGWSKIYCSKITDRVVGISLSASTDVIIYPNFTSLLQFTELQTLYLGKNIGGAFPDVLCDLKRLKELYLVGNSLEGHIPRCLCNVSSLTHLDLSQNQHLRGSIPSCLGNLHNLEQLTLHDNELEGSIPPSVFPNLTKLRSVDIGGDRLEGTLSFSAFANTSNLEQLVIYSKYGLEIETESPSWVPSFQLTHLNIRGCVVNRRNGGRLPSFIPTQSSLKTLALPDLALTGALPLSLFYNSSLGNLDLKGNMLQGTFHHLLCHNTSCHIAYLDLFHNKVHGSLPADIGFCFPKLTYFIMAGNELEGSIPPSLGQAPLEVLDLSDNNLSGKLPQALTRNQTTLRYLNTSYNQLDGNLPMETYMPNLSNLYLHHNRFTGPIPPNLSNSSLLKTLHIGQNDLSCSLSHCLPSFPSMLALSLRKNHLQGELPSHLCHMQHLHLLDLSENNLSGEIPPCLNNISFWKLSIHEGINDTEGWGAFSPDEILYFTSKNLVIPYQGVPLTWMTGLDMSSNQLDGAIPLEIGDLGGLRSLNLSNNRLQGHLPRTIGNMESLESLDLSHNNLTSTIPHSILQLHFLTTFSVAFNHLSGTIPYNQQFSTFPSNSYEGNSELCGAPLERNCSSNTDAGTTLLVDGKELVEGSSILDNMVFFYSFVALSFALGFWGFISTIFFKKKWRVKYFAAIDRFFYRYLG